MLYSECVKCPKIGVTCGGPDFVEMDAREILEWCRARKAFVGISNAKIAEQSNMPKGTIDRLFSGEHLDFRYESIRPVLKTLIGGQWISKQCPMLDTELEHIQAQLGYIANERDILKNTVSDLNRNIQQLHEEHTASIQLITDRLENKIKYHRITSSIMTGLLIAVLFVVIAFLIVDMVNPNIGFFYRG